LSISPLRIESVEMNSIRSEARHGKNLRGHHILEDAHNIDGSIRR
jgi:hypothetical protein